MNEAIIRELNQRIAKMLCCEQKEVKVEFVPLIERKQTFKDGMMISTEVKGRCFVDESRIELVAARDWGVTLIEELIHLYDPQMRHPKVKQLVRQCVRYLKAQLVNEEEGSA